MSAAAHEHAGEEQLADGDDGPKEGDTETITPQRNYAQRIRGRFRAIRAEIIRGVEERDIFGRGGAQSPTTELLAPTGNWDPTELTPESYRSRSSAQQHDRFMQWLRQQQRAGILEISSNGDNTFVRRGYDQGVKYAEQKLRAEGVDVSTDILQTTFNMSMRGETLDMLYSRNYSLLEGLTEDVAKGMSETLTRGLLEGLGPDDIAENLVDQIDTVAIPRATTIARHEVLLAHNQASINRYQQSGIVDRVEVLTTDPCDDCATYANGAPYTLEEARGGLPNHPRCVCSFSPIVN